jgi:hypothetical protein
MPPPRRFPFCPADAVAAVAVLCIAALLLLWVRSRHLGGDERVLDAPGARLHFCSRDGRIMLGVFWREPRVRYSMVPIRSEMRELINDDSRWGFFNFLGWGVAAPHGALMTALAVVPVWWWVVHRGRLEEQRRRSSGLCRECGYDLRVATTRCPECGTDIGVAGLRRIVRPIDGLAGDPMKTLAGDDGSNTAGGGTGSRDPATSNASTAA